MNATERDKAAPHGLRATLLVSQGTLFLNRSVISGT